MLGIFLDTETNGLNPFKHRILEIAFKIVDVMNGTLIDSYQTIIFQPHEIWERSDNKSLEINGFTYEMLEEGVDEEIAAEEILAFFKKYHIHRKEAAFVCQNPSFDRLFFSQLIAPEKQDKNGWPYHWLDLASMFWCRLFRESSSTPPWTIGLSKDSIALYYSLEKETAPHRAMNGVDHLLLCYEKVVGFPQR